jgi:hypothetical protein
VTTWHRFAALLLPLLAQAAALSQTIYRCGPDGRSYSQAPCADGKPLTMDDPRSATQQQAAREVAAGDAARAQKLADERRQREADAPRQAAGFMTSPTQAASAPARKPKKTKKSQPAAERDFTATSRAPPKTSSKR